MFWLPHSCARPSSAALTSGIPRFLGSPGVPAEALERMSWWSSQVLFPQGSKSLLTVQPSASNRSVNGPGPLGAASAGSPCTLQVQPMAGCANLTPRLRWALFCDAVHLQTKASSRSEPSLPHLEKQLLGRALHHCIRREGWVGSVTCI